MNKNVLIISSSPRRGGNSEQLAYAFEKGASEAGNNVEVVCLYNKKISFCKGCLSCQKTNRCIIHDDAVNIAEKMLNADVIVFATPVYYYSVSGQLKTMLDRANPLYSADYAFRDIYLLASAAEDEESTCDGCVKVIEGWTDCFEKARFAGKVFAGGVNDIGDIKGHKALNNAYEMGKSV